MLKFQLYQNQPNPFHSATLIRYIIPKVGARRAVPLRLAIYDLTGRLVETLVDGKQEPGVYQVEWKPNVVVQNFKHLPSGIYFYRLQSETFTATKKFILLR